MIEIIEKFLNLGMGVIDIKMCMMLLDEGLCVDMLVEGFGKFCVVFVNKGSVIVGNSL